MRVAIGTVLAEQGGRSGTPEALAKAVEVTRPKLPQAKAREVHKTRGPEEQDLATGREDRY